MLPFFSARLLLGVGRLAASTSPRVPDVHLEIKLGTRCRRTSAESRTCPRSHCAPQACAQVCSSSRGANLNKNWRPRQRLRKWHRLFSRPESEVEPQGHTALAQHCLETSPCSRLRPSTHACFARRRHASTRPSSCKSDHGQTWVVSVLSGRRLQSRRALQRAVPNPSQGLTGA